MSLTVGSCGSSQVQSYMDLAAAEGGTVLCGGGPPSPCDETRGGAYLMPTLVEGLDHSARKRTSHALAVHSGRTDEPRDEFWRLSRR